MGFSLAEQTRVFLEAGLLGVLGGLIYDLCRAVRRTAHTGTLGTALADLAFWLAALGALFYFAVTDAAAQLRAYVILGEGLGMALYFLCFSPLLLPGFAALLRAAGRVLRAPVRAGGRFCIFVESKIARLHPGTQILKKVKKKLPFSGRSG